MICVQHHNHKITLVDTKEGVHIRLYLQKRLVGSTVVDDQPFHVLLDRAYDWVRQRDWPTPADLANL